MAGGQAIFTGARFFSNRALAMGLRGPVSGHDIERVETFYAKHGAAAQIEIATMADRTLIQHLNQLGYRLIRFHNIFAQPLRPTADTDAKPDAQSSAADIHMVNDATASDWSITLLDGFEYTTDADRDRVETWNQMIYSLPNMTTLLASIDGEPVGSASVMILGRPPCSGGLRPFRHFGVRGCSAP